MSIWSWRYLRVRPSSRRPLAINGVPAPKFIKEAYDLSEDLSGPGRYDLDDPVQQGLRHVRDWITMAEHDALESRREAAQL